MDHLTDHEISRFWMGGPEDEAAFNRTIVHMHQCKVCRERSWQWIKGMREEAGKVFGALIESLGKKLDPSAKDEDKLAEGLANAVKIALDKLAANPKQQEWDSEDLFGTEQFDDVVHLARCRKCRRIFDAMLKITETVITKADENKDAKLKSAGVRLQQWFKVVRSRIQENMDLTGATDDDDGPGGNNSRAFCN